MRSVLLAIIPLLFIGVTAVSADRETPPPDVGGNVVGGDVDEHGCRGSAGYAWCEKTQQCERPWELASSEGFENSQDAFRAFCEGE